MVLGWSVLLPVNVTAPDLEAFLALLAAEDFDLTLDLELEVLAEAFLLATGWFMTLAVLGVGLVVQYHLLFASAHAWPSLAVPYVSLADIELPKGSNNLAWPPLLLKLRPVEDE